eukprot:scaffold94594_cov37-Prasinocladus_malaysianus.AAC.1
MDILQLANESDLPLVVCRRHPRIPSGLEIVTKSEVVEKLLKHIGLDRDDIALYADADEDFGTRSLKESLKWIQSRDGSFYVHAWLALEQEGVTVPSPTQGVRPVPVLLKRLDSSSGDDEFTATIVNHHTYRDLCPTAQGVWLWFPLHGSEFMNDAFWEQLGYDSQYHDHYPPHLPSSWENMIDPECFKNAIKNLELMIQTDGKVPYDSRVTYQRLDGSYVYLRCQGVPLLWTHDGQLLALLGSHTDISADNRDRLSKISFIGKISHEIRTPLNAITGCLDIVSDSLYHDDASREAVGILKNATQQVVETVNDLILFSTLSAGRLALNKVATHYESFIADVVQMYRLSAADKNINLSAAPLPADMPEEVLVDRMRLKQVLANLLSNAIKFTPAGGSVSVVTTCTAKRASVLYYSIDVVDTGCGIPRVLWESIFEDFKQARTSDQNEGTGLGLAICSMLVSIHGGRIFVESSSRELGTTMRVQLETPQIASTSTARSPVEISGEEKLSLGKVLIVDDIRTNVFVLKAMIKKNIDKKAEISVAENGKIAVSMALEQRFDFILMDIHMPVMDGIEASRLITEKDPTACIIGFTADTDERTKELCRSSGMVDILVKPSPPKALQETFAGLVHKQRSDRASPINMVEHMRLSIPAVQHQSIDCHGRISARRNYIEFGEKQTSPALSTPTRISKGTCLNVRCRTGDGQLAAHHMQCSQTMCCQSKAHARYNTNAESFQFWFST